MFPRARFMASFPRRFQSTMAANANSNPRWPYAANGAAVATAIIGIAFFGFEYTNLREIGSDVAALTKKLDDQAIIANAQVARLDSQIVAQSQRTDALFSALITAQLETKQAHLETNKQFYELNSKLDKKWW